MKRKKNRPLKESLSYLQVVYRRFRTFFHDIINSSSNKKNNSNDEYGDGDEGTATVIT